MENQRAPKNKDARRRWVSAFRKSLSGRKGERGSGNGGNDVAQNASKAGDAKRIAPRESRLWMPRPDRRKGYRPSAAFRSASFALR